MSAWELTAMVGGVGPHLAAVSLCAARLLPVSFLCPVLGGPAVPVSVRLGLVLALSSSIHVVGDVRFPQPFSGALWMGALGRELMFGTVIGLVATLPFEAARIAGRIGDLARGTNAEAVLPGIATRESASGELLHRLLVALVVSGVGLPRIISSLWHSFGVVRLGAAPMGEGLSLEVAGLVGGALATGLAVGAPVVALTLLVDLGLGLISRAVAPLSLQELRVPVRILGGGVVLWLTVGIASERLLADVLTSTERLAQIFGMLG